MTKLGSLFAGPVAASAAFVWAGAAAAHPHVLVDARSEVVFDDSGRMASVRQVWQFDPAFTAYAIQGLDSDGDGQLSDEELMPLAETNVDALSEYDYFTFLTVDDQELDFVPPQEYWLEFDGGNLTLFYDLPLKTPTRVGKETTLEVFDPDYFVAFNFVKDDPVIITNAPAGCTAVYYPPQELDDQTMAMLAAIPREQHDLPPELAAAASVLSNIAKITCP